MARIRSIKPEFFRHHDLFLLEQSSGFPIRTAYSGLWLCADKEGRFRWLPMQLKLDVLPYDELDFEDVLESLEQGGFIRSYEVDGKKYGFIPSFKEHQRITGSESTAESKLPCPTDSYEKRNTEETPRNPQGRQEREGKGKGKGKGVIGRDEVPATFSMQKIYEKSWLEYSGILSGQAKKLDENIFTQWKEFVDFIWANNYQDIFVSKFVSPIDFGELISKKGFHKDRWGPVVEKILATGVNQNQNLFFRIPQFLNYTKKDDTGKTNTGGAGRSIEFDKP